MKTYLPFALLFCCCLYFSCKTNGKRNMMPDLAKADSASVIYYDTPDNPRFFTFAKQHDVKKLSQVIEDVNSRVIEVDQDCPTLGKIYFYGKKGAIDVIYFNNNSRCMTFSFIITGEKYFVKMNSESASLLNVLKSSAIEPISNN